MNSRLLTDFLLIPNHTIVDLLLRSLRLKIFDNQFSKRHMAT